MSEEINNVTQRGWREREGGMQGASLYLCMCENVHTRHELPLVRARRARIKNENAFKCTQERREKPMMTQNL